MDTTTSQRRTRSRPAAAGSLAAAALLAGLAAPAQARVGWSLDIGLPVAFGGAYYGGHGPYGGYRGPVYAAPTVGVHVGGGHWRGGHRWHRPWGPAWGVVVAPSVVWPVVTAPPPVYAEASAPPPPPSRPDPVIYPRNGQSAGQTEADRQDCNRWATTQPAALADAQVFQRAVEACMDGRGYTMK